MNLNGIVLIGAAVLIGLGVLGRKDGTPTPPSSPSAAPTLLDAIQATLTEAGAQTAKGEEFGEEAGFGLAFGTPGAQTSVVTVAPDGTVRFSNAATDDLTVASIAPNEVGIGTSAAVVTPLGSVYTQFSQGGFTDIGERLTSDAQLTQYQRQVQGEVATYGTRTTTARLGGGGVEYVGTGGAYAEQIQAAVAAGNWTAVTALQTSWRTSSSATASRTSSGSNIDVSTTRVNNLGRVVAKDDTGHWVSV